VARERLSSQELAERIRRNTIKRLLGDQGFKDFLLWFFTNAGILQQSYGSDERATCFKEGRRGLGNEVLLELMLASPEAGQLIFPDSATLARVMGKATNRSTSEDPDDGPSDDS
jgi:hypothetical protein